MQLTPGNPRHFFTSLGKVRRQLQLHAGEVAQREAGQVVEPPKAKTPKLLKQPEPRLRLNLKQRRKLLAQKLRARKEVEKPLRPRFE